MEFVCSVKAGDKMEGDAKAFREEDCDGYAQTWDDVTEVERNAKEVRKARVPEIQYVDEKEAGRTTTRKEAMRKGIKVACTRRIATNKGNTQHMIHRSRPVAKERHNS